MMIKLYALEVMEGNMEWKDIKFSPIIKDRIKAYIRKLVEDDEIFNELTKEGQPMHIKPEHVYALVGFVSTVVGLWTNFSAKITKQENRITVLEKDIENLKEFKESANRRLDSHDEQNKAILVLAEQVKSMGEDIRELKRVIMKEG